MALPSYRSPSVVDNGVPSFSTQKVSEPGQNRVMPVEAPVEVVESDTDVVLNIDRPWVVLVWNDPINLMPYVTMVIQKVFGYSREKAEKMMWDVHTKGKAVVSNGNREQAEMYVFRLHEFGLWATMQQDD
jgi:ATP-dependent Clp protease adaptor protein ClpS